MCISYTPAELRGLNKGTTNIKISTQYLYKISKQWGILKRTTTRRGCRGGIKRSNFPPEPKKKDNLCIALWNAQSLRNKDHIVTDYITQHDIDIFLVTETWLTDADDGFKNQLCPPGYTMHQSNRSHRQGGGIACIYKEHLSLTKIDPPTFTTFEIMEMLLNINSIRVHVVTIYRPPPSQANRYSLRTLMAELEEMFAHYQMLSDELFISGDFNFHFNDDNDTLANEFQSLLNSLSLVQHVQCPTHRLGNILDLVITRSNSLLNSCDVDLLLSDHHVVLNCLAPHKAAAPVRTSTFRKLKSINIDDFKTDLSILCGDIEKGTLDGLVHAYNACLKKVLDKHAPTRTQMVTLRKPTPWISDDIRPLKQARRRLERKWRRTRSAADFTAYNIQKNLVNDTLRKMKIDYMRKTVNDNAKDPKGLFKIINNLLGRKQKCPFPPEIPKEELAEGFSNFFLNKISNIRLLFTNPTNNQNHTAEYSRAAAFDNFTALTELQVRKLIIKSPTKHCMLDPIPTWILKSCLDVLLPLITRIVNLSLSSGSMPRELKNAVINPLPKKPGLDFTFTNYRPVSNIPFLSKVIERAVAEQLTEHLSKHELWEVFQSAYRRNHSTETALLRVQNDILSELDKRHAVALLLLDLSAAFDTIDHEILLNRLSVYVGIDNTALQWFRSYLTDRSQSVKIEDKTSAPRGLLFGVPQGSVLGPILFTLYMLPLGELIRQHKIQYHMYADDTQLYIAFDPSDPSPAAISQITTCVDNIKVWMNDNKLKLNDEKTELVIFATTRQLQNINFDSVNIGSTSVKKSSVARNLGIMYDENLNLKSHVNNMCKKSYLHLRNLSNIRKYLDKSTTETAVHAFISSILDYGNSLLYGIPNILTQKLQLVQNCAVRIVTGARKFDRVSHLRRELHWLPITERIKFKTLVLTWKCLHNQAPLYLRNLIRAKVNSRSLRSSDENLLYIPRTSLKSCGDRAFYKAAPLLWNNLPSHIRDLPTLDNFKTALKTHLFK